MRKKNTSHKLLEKIISNAPYIPGVYMMLDKKQKILYIGKAKSLKKRLKSYLNNKDQVNRIKQMIYYTNNIDLITTSTEEEALLLEANLIKKHKPHFNVQLKDDKSFPYILIKKNGKWPELTKHRGKQIHNGNYFGPFASAGAVNKTLKILQKVFLLRSCSDSYLNSRTRPCLLYQIKRCSAPCVDYITEQNYQNNTKATINFLSGHDTKIQNRISKLMEKSSKIMDFEKAAIYRDQIKALTDIQSNFNPALFKLKNADIISLVQSNGKSCVAVMFVRSNQNWGTKFYYPTHRAEEDKGVIGTSFLGQFYIDKIPPGTIVCNEKFENIDLLQKALRKKNKKNISITVPQNGHIFNLIKSIERKAELSLNSLLTETELNTKNLQDLRRLLDIKREIKKVEVYDNSHMQGSLPTGAMIAVDKNGFVKNSYRKYNLKNEHRGNDYAMLKEVLTRRFIKKSKSRTTLSNPDLIMVDGGKAQFSAATDILKKSHINKIPVIAISKGKSKGNKIDQFYFSGSKNPIIKINSSIYFFLQRLRDEAHRFAITSYRNKRAKVLVMSILDEMPNIGVVRKKKLLNRFGSVKNIKKASIKDLQMINGIGRDFAKKIHTFFHQM